MIQTNELRIGNYILYLNELYVVDGVKYEGNAPSSKWRIAFRTIDGKSRNAKMENWIEPIPLTPEILEKAGFNNTRFRITNGSHDITISDDGDGWAFEPWISNIFIKIKYVHQLQNLYFSLTGEELSITL